MEILTGGVCGDAGDIALLLRKTVRRKGDIPIAFLCVAEGAEASDRRELLSEWFRQQALPLCENGSPERAVDAVTESFAVYFGHGGHSGLSMAVLFCMGRECFYARQGEAQLRAINICFDRSHMKGLAASADGFCCERAALEQGVGLVLGNRSFFAYLPEAQLKECLKAGEICRQEQAQRHLAEAAEEAKRRGAAKPAAAFLMLREGHSREFESMLRQNGYAEPVAVGSGAFGCVYRVKKGGRRYACKLAEGAEERRLLRQEAALQRSLVHPLFARYVNVLEGNACTLFLMEYVRGRDLSTVLKSRTPKRALHIENNMSEKQAVQVAAQLAEGLQYLHTLPNPVLYRDLKPENIRITPAGNVKLLDLGCACRLSEANLTQAGSRGYAAPEQLGQINVPPGFYSDVYALGRLLIRMTEGTAVSPVLHQLILKCVSPDPSDRFQSMIPLLELLDKINALQKVNYLRM